MGRRLVAVEGQNKYQMKAALAILPVLGIIMMNMMRMMNMMIMMNMMNMMRMMGRTKPVHAYIEEMMTMVMSKMRKKAMPMTMVIIVIDNDIFVDRK